MEGAPVQSSSSQCNRTPKTGHIDVQASSSPDAVVQLPAAVACTFVGEGSANVVFAIQEPPEDSKAPTPLQGPPNGPPQPLASAFFSTHLLRIPKATPGVGPAICRDNHAYYTGVLQPLLGAGHLVDQRLAAGVVRTGLAAALNAVLADRDRTGCRRPDWVGVRVAADVDVALLVEDMGSSALSLSPSTSSSSSRASITIQFKPKWLAQSPDAPADARRCRTCALSAAAAAAGKTHKIKACPMVLVAAGQTTTTTDAAALDDALWAYLCQHLGDDMPPATRARLTAAARPALVRWLRTTDLFRRLAAVQRAFDPHGVLSVVGEGAAGQQREPAPAAAETLENLQTAMTVRDCSCFLQVRWDEDEDGAARPASVTITAKLGDLDRKDGSRKVARWASQEKALLAGGFYAAPKTGPETTDCWLERAVAAAAANLQTGTKTR